MTRFLPFFVVSLLALSMSGCVPYGYGRYGGRYGGQVYGGASYSTGSYSTTTYGAPAYGYARPGYGTTYGYGKSQRDECA